MKSTNNNEPKQSHLKVDSEKELSRLKKIIEKKNSVIGELTEEMRSLRDEVSELAKLTKNRHFHEEKRNTSCECDHLKKEITFFQANNL